MCSKQVHKLVWLVPRVMDASADGYQAADLWPPLELGSMVFPRVDEPSLISLTSEFVCSLHR